MARRLGREIGLNVGSPGGDEQLVAFDTQSIRVQQARIFEEKTERGTVLQHVDAVGEHVGDVDAASGIDRRIVQKLRPLRFPAIGYLRLC